MKAKFTTLGEHIATQKGYAFKSGWFCDSGRPVVKVKDFTANSVDPIGVTHVSEEIAVQYLKYQLRTGDVVIQTVGSWPSAPASVVGKCIRIPRSVDRSLLNQNAVKISPLSSLDGGFLYYTLKNPAFSEYIVGTAQGAASQAAITLESIRGYKINLPPLPIQRKIAGILSAYDDLIENNLRRIKILEEIAQSLYREWFVHFRFPSHESVKMVDSELGMIPEGWEWKKVGDVFEILGGGTPSTTNEEFWTDGDIQWYSPRDLTAQSTMFIEKSAVQINELGLKKSSAKMFPAYSVMLTSRATIGAIAINTVPSCTNQGFITCIPSAEVPLYFLHQWLKANVETFILNASGSTFKEISKGVFKGLDFLVPNADLVQQYQQVVSPLADQLLNLQRRNQNLRRTRDLVLQKIIK